MCGDVVQRNSYFLHFVPYWFVTQEQLEIWHDGDDYCTGDELIEWCKRYEKRKAQKAKIILEIIKSNKNNKAKKRVNAYCLASRSCDGLVYDKR